MSSGKKHRFGNEWMNEHVNDSYVKKAKKAGYRARSAFKLEEIDKKDKLLRPGLNVVDLVRHRVAGVSMRVNGWAKRVAWLLLIFYQLKQSKGYRSLKETLLMRKSGYKSMRCLRISRLTLCYQIWPPI